MSGIGKRWYRRRTTHVVGGLVAGGVIAVIATVVYAVVWSLTAQAEPSVDYGRRLEVLSAGAQPPGENGWPYLEEAAAIMEGVSVEMGLRETQFDDLSAPAAVPTTQEAIGALETRGAFAQLAAAGRCPNAVRSWPSRDEGWVLSSDMSEMHWLWLLSKARLASMELAIAGGNVDGAVDAFDQALVIADCCSHQMTNVTQLVGWAVAGMAVDRLRDVLAAHELDAPTMARFQERLAARRPFGHPAQGLDGERLIFLDFVQRTHTDDGRGSGRMLPWAASDFAPSDLAAGSSSSGPGRRVINVRGWFLASRKDLTRESEAFFREAIRQANLPRCQRQFEPEDVWVYFEGLGPRYVLLSAFMPAVAEFVQQHDALQCRLGGTTLELAIEGYRAEYGALPPTLDALAPSWIDVVPVDPYSGAPFVYRFVRTDEDSRGYVLYSVGADGVDDGGAGNPIEPEAALTARGSGTDYVISRPLPDQPPE